MKSQRDSYNPDEALLPHSEPDFFLSSVRKSKGESVKPSFFTAGYKQRAKLVCVVHWRTQVFCLFSLFVLQRIVPGGSSGFKGKITKNNQVVGGGP